MTDPEAEVAMPKPTAEGAGKLEGKRRPEGCSKLSPVSWGVKGHSTASEIRATRNTQAVPKPKKLYLDDSLVEWLGTWR